LLTSFGVLGNNLIAQLHVFDWSPSTIGHHHQRPGNEAVATACFRRLHDLRHGAATLTLAAGADMKTVQQLLGHSTYTLTANTYTSVLPAYARTAAENTANLIPRNTHN
jgi:integrase